MEENQLRFEPSREYIVTFGNVMNPIRLPEGLAVRCRSKKLLNRGDQIPGGFLRPAAEVSKEVSEFRRDHPEIFLAKQFIVIGCMGQHCVFVIPCQPRA